MQAENCKGESIQNNALKSRSLTTKTYNTSNIQQSTVVSRETRGRTSEDQTVAACGGKSLD